MNYRDFATQIRTKYPGSYDQVDDKTLAEKVVSKYPTYADRVDFETPSGLEAGVRGGAQGLSLGFADEATGGLQTVRDYVMGRKSVFDKGPGDVYRRNRDLSREKYEAAQEAHPYIYGGAQMAGAIAPAIAATVGTGGAGVGVVGARLGALGLAEGLGHTEADVTKGEFGRAGQDVALSGAIGAVMPAAFKGIGAGIKGAARPVMAAGKAVAQKFGPTIGAKTTGQRALTAFTNTPLEAIEAYTERPAAIKAVLGRSSTDLAEKELVTEMSVLAKKTNDFYKAAMKTLDTKKPAFSVGEINTMIDGVQAGFKGARGKTISKAKNSALSSLENYRKKIATYIPKRAKTTTTMVAGKPTIDPFTRAVIPGVPEKQVVKSLVDQPKKAVLTQRDMKNLLDDLRADIKRWDVKGGDTNPTSLSLKSLQGKINQRLGSVNSQYAEKMGVAAEHVGLLKNLEKQFGLTKFGPKDARTYQAGKQAAGLLERVPKDKEIDARKYLQDLQGKTGKEGQPGVDILGKAEDIRLAGMLQGGRTQGSRSAFGYGTGGAALGYGVGGPPGAFAGGVLGAGVGAHVDKFGGEYARRIIDAFRNYKVGGNIGGFLKASPESFGQWAPLLQKAAQRGTSHLITTHYVLQQQDPEYRKQLDNIDEHFQGAPR